MTHITYRLTAENRDHLRNHTLGNRVWAAFAFLVPLYLAGELTGIETGQLRSAGKQSAGNPWSQCWRRKGRKAVTLVHGGGTSVGSQQRRGWRQRHCVTTAAQWWMHGGTHARTHAR